VISLQDLLQKDKIRAAFKLFDTDGNGKISMQDLRQALKSSSDGQTAAWLSCFNEADKDRDGELNFNEFNVMLVGIA